MRLITLANLRSGGSRLIAAGIAVVISAAFVVTVFSLVDAFERTMRAQAEAAAAGSDITITYGSNAPEYQAQLSEKLRGQIADVPGVANAQLIDTGSSEYTSGGQHTMLYPTTVAEGRPVKLEAGRTPQEADELMLYADVADSLGISHGDTVSLVDSEGGSEAAMFAVTGIIAGSEGGLPVPYLTAAGMQRLPSATPESLRVRLADGASGEEVTAVQEKIAALTAGDSGASVEDSGSSGLEVAGLQVQTSDQLVAAKMQALTGDSTVLLSVVLGFAAIAVTVAALVISNTFHVLVASRTRSLALMRAVGATRGQIRAATLAEGLVLGALGSIIGVLAGWLGAVGLARAAQATIQPTFADAGLPVAAIVAGLGVGITVTVLASLLPARKATQVSPMAALQPLDVAAPADRIAWLPLIAGSLMTGAGLVATVFGALAHELPIALGGGILAFLGVLALGRVVLPPLVGWLGRGLARVCGNSQVIGLVARNARSAPRRTASTTAALLIGVTLVTTLMVGAQTMKATNDSELAKRHAVDLVVASPTDGARRALADSAIVTTHRALPGAMAQVEPATQVDAGAVGRTADPEAPSARALAVRPGDLDGILRGTGDAGNLSAGKGVAYASPNTLESLGLDHPVTAVLRHGSGQVRTELHPHSGLPAGTILAAADDIAPLSVSGSDGLALARLADDADGAQVQQLAGAIEAAGGEPDPAGAVTRASTNQIITVALLVTLVMLAAAVVIAVIGVGNTLSLAVIERRRESALLRALGMSRAALGAMVSIEAVLMALVALILGTGLGVFFGWAGLSSLIAREDASILLDVPWLQLAGVAAAAILAAVLASAIPARTTSRTAPAAGLAS